MMQVDQILVRTKTGLLVPVSEDELKRAQDEGLVAKFAIVESDFDIMDPPPPAAPENPTEVLQALTPGAEPKAMGPFGHTPKVHVARSTRSRSIAAIEGEPFEPNDLR